MPPFASTNLPACFSVAPVKAPFSCPKRIDSTRFSGSAPQLTVTKGLPRRSDAPWIARAISSLPTPDSPSISTGMVELRGALAKPNDARHLLAFGDDVPEAERCRTLRRLMRRISSSSASTRSAFLIETCSRSAPTGLTTKSCAPARIAEITASIEPCAVCTIDGHADLALAHAAEHAHAVEIGHDEIEDQEIDRGLARRLEPRQRRLARYPPPRSHSRNGAPWLRAGAAEPDRRLQ